METLKTILMVIAIFVVGIIITPIAIIGILQMLAGN